MIVLLALHIGLALQTAPASPPLIIVPQGTDRYLATVDTFAGVLLAEVDDAVAERATRICGSRRVVRGEYHYNRERAGAGSSQIEQYRNGFRCAAEASALPPAPAGWTASRQDETDVRAIFSAYYARRDAGDAEAAFDMYESGALADHDRWIAKVGRQREIFGQGKRRITGLRWLLNPPGTGHPGAFAVVAFDGDYPALHFYCGMLVIHRRGPGDYRIVLEDVGFYARDGDQPYPGNLAQAKIDECHS